MEESSTWKIGREEDRFNSNVKRKYWSFTCNQLLFLYVERWKTKSMEAVNERDPSNCKSIQRVNRRGGGGSVKRKEMINGLLGLLANGKEKAARDLVFFYICIPNRFGSGWPVQAHQNWKPNRTRYFPKYFNRLNRFFLLVRFFFVYFFSVFSVKSVFWFFYSPLAPSLQIPQSLRWTKNL